MGRFRTYQKSTNKYHNHIITIDKIRFASKGEAQRYIELRAMKKAGEIIDFELQPAFELQPTYRKCCGKIWLVKPGYVPKREKRCTVCSKMVAATKSVVYRADFRVTYPDGHQEIEDVKGKGGYTNPEFDLKHKLFEYRYPDLHLEIVQRSGKGMEYFDESCDGDNISNGGVII